MFAFLCTCNAVIAECDAAFHFDWRKDPAGDDPKNKNGLFFDKGQLFESFSNFVHVASPPPVPAGRGGLHVEKVLRYAAREGI